MEQIELAFDGPSPSPLDNLALWTPRDIWVRLNQSTLELFREDKRLERKAYKSPNLDGLAEYLSMFSNSLDGGVLVYGITDNGTIEGCHFSTDQINKVERCHITHCPGAKPEFKRVPVVVNDKQEFVLAIFAPCVGELVETNKGEAFQRHGSSKHRMSHEEKEDFRATRNELAFEMKVATAYRYPDDFDLRIVQDFCDEFRLRESKPDWTNEEVLLDRHLLRLVDGARKPLNSLVLLAARDPALSIPGCRVRVQRFESTVEGAGDTYSPLKDMVIEGNVVRLIQGAREAISSLLFDVTWLNNEGKFVTTPEYPQYAWFEALVNACVHRSYSYSGTETTVKVFADRMEVESPGSFVPPVTEQTIYYTRASRNHHLMDALRILGYVRMSREGTRRMKETMAEYQLPEPEFKQEALHGVVVRVTLKNDQQSRKRASNRDVALHFGVEVWRKLEEHEIKLAAYAFRNGKIQVSEAQRLTGRTWASSKKDLERLVKKEVLAFQAGTYIRDSKAHYVLAKPPAAAASAEPAGQGK